MKIVVKQKRLQTGAASALQRFTEEYLYIKNYWNFLFYNAEVLNLSAF